jgi:hypothetical protein
VYSARGHERLRPTRGPRSVPSAVAFTRGHTLMRKIREGSKGTVRSGSRSHETRARRPWQHLDLAQDTPSVIRFERTDRAGDDRRGGVRPAGAVKDGVFPAVVVFGVGHDAGQVAVVESPQVLGAWKIVALPPGVPAHAAPFYLVALVPNSSLS